MARGNGRGNINRRNFIMERTVFLKYEKENDVILPERYIKSLIDCDDDPEKICKDYGDVTLFSFQVCRGARVFRNEKMVPELHSNWKYR